jgi:hypothetical protein
VDSVNKGLHESKFRLSIRWQLSGTLVEFTSAARFSIVKCSDRPINGWRFTESVNRIPIVNPGMTFVRLYYLLSDISRYSSKFSSSVILIQLTTVNVKGFQTGNRSRINNISALRSADTMVKN